MTCQKFSDFSRNNIFCVLTLTLAGIVLILMFSVYFSSPLCSSFDCKSPEVRILGKLVRYPKRIGIRHFSVDQEFARAFQAIKNDEVIFSSLHIGTGLFSAKFAIERNDPFEFVFDKGLSNQPFEFVVACPTKLVYSHQCNNTESLVYWLKVQVTFVDNNNTFYTKRHIADYKKTHWRQ